MGPGRVVRIGDPDHASPCGHHRPHGHEVVSIVDGRDDAQGGPDRHAADRVDRKGVLREQALTTAPEKRARHHVEHIVGPVADRHACRIDTMMRCQGTPQLISTTVRITTQIGDLRLERGTHLWTRPQRILVGGQLDRTTDPKLAFEFGQRLARHIRL